MTTIRLMASRHSSFYSPLICTIAGGFLEKEGLTGEYHVVEAGGEFGPGEVRATGALNGGGPVLRLRNTSGRIQIRRLESR